MSNTKRFGNISVRQRTARGDDEYSESVGKASDFPATDMHKGRISGSNSENRKTSVAIPSGVHIKHHIGFATAFQFGLAFGMGMALAVPVLIFLAVIVLGILGIAIT